MANTNTAFIAIVVSILDQEAGKAVFRPFLCKNITCTVTLDQAVFEVTMTRTTTDGQN